MMIKVLSWRTFARMPAVASSVSHWLSVARQRRALASLEDHLLDDIGVDRDAAEAEADRLPWDGPSHWKR